jgi:hypothetical protein
LTIWIYLNPTGIIKKKILIITIILFTVAALANLDELSSHHSPIGIEVVQKKVKIYPEALFNTLKSKSIGNEIIPTLLILEV